MKHAVTLAVLLLAGPAVAEDGQATRLLDMIRASDCAIEVTEMGAFMAAAKTDLGLGISPLMGEVQVLMDRGLATEQSDGTLKLSDAACAGDT